MKLNFRILAFSALATLSLSTPSFAAADVLKVNGLGVLHGQVIAWDAAAEIVTFKTEEGVVHKIKAADLDRLSAYKLAKSKAEKGSAEDQLKLGNFARTIELYAYAGRHYHSAIDLDPSMKAAVEKEQAVNRRQAAEYCMRLAREAGAKNDLKTAEKWLTTLVDKLPDEPLAAEASAILTQHYEKNHAAKDDELEAKYAEKLSSDLKTGKKHYDSMLKNIKDGLGNTGSTASAKRHFENAWKDGTSALSELDKVQSRHEGEEDIAELFDGYRVLINEHMVDAQLHLASHYSTQTSYQQALEAVNKALSIDPKNSEALAARARIEEAASEGGLRRRWW